MTNSHLSRKLPEKLKDLSDLVLDLRWTTSQLTRGFWERLDPDAWERIENPYLILLDADQERLNEVANDQDLLRELAHWRRKMTDYRHSPTWFSEIYPKSKLRGVAYFSMEFGLSESLPIYSGGLGMLAGDHLKSASDLGIPLVGIGILYQQGYFRQVLADDGSQLEAFPYNDPNSLPVTPVLGGDGRWLRMRIELPGRTLLLRIWKARVGNVPLYLLDSNDPLNSPWDRGITANLYAAGKDKRLLQEIVLGIGGWRLMETLGIDIDVCHLNEGHAAFAVLARAVSFAAQAGVPMPVAFRATRAGNVFTTHTPVAAAFDEFDPALIVHYAGPFSESSSVRIDRVLALGRSDPFNTREPFNMAYLAMRGCCHVNAVSRLHGRVSRRLFNRLFPAWPEVQVPVRAITNGVHIPTWNSLAARELWVKILGSDTWLRNIEDATRVVGEIDPVELWNLRARARQSLVEYVRRRLTRQLMVGGAPVERVREARHALDPNALTIGFARRFTEYKRPNLLLRDPERLKRLLLHPERPVQLIVAGKAHPNDAHGKSLVREMAQFFQRPELEGRAVFLEDYDMVLAQRLAAGIDVWLNTPRRPAEACGTSGMKMLFNGGLNLSVLDGWWDEAWSREVGWAIGGGDEDDDPNRDAREARQLLDLLEKQVIPEFYDRDHNGIPHAWLNRVRASMARLTAYYCSDRMVKDYVEQAYLPAAKAVHHRTAQQAKIGHDLYDWHLELEENWRGLHFGELKFNEADGRWHFRVQAYLGDLAPDAVRIELFADSPSGGDPTVVGMQRGEAIPGAVNGYLFTAAVPSDRPAEHYTPRIVPWHPDAFVPQEESRIYWHH